MNYNEEKSNRKRLTTILLLFLIFASSVSCSNGNRNNLFKKGKIWHYDAIFQNADSIIYYDLELIPGGVFLFQQKIKWILKRYHSEDKLNVVLSSEATTGFIENESKIWLHPPRSDSFKFITQLAPYPAINLPVEVGKVEQGSISGMMGNWGKYTGKSTVFEVSVIGKEFSQIVQDSVWVIQGYGYLESDTSYVTHLFSEKSGFVKSNYITNKGEKFEMILKEIIERE